MPSGEASQQALQKKGPPSSGKGARQEDYGHQQGKTDHQDTKKQVLHRGRKT